MVILEYDRRDREQRRDRHGVAAGDVDITATYQNVAGHAHVTITSVANYKGSWKGDYTATACDGVNGLCDPGDLGVGSVHSTNLSLKQNGTAVTGFMIIGIGLPAVSGSVDANGHFVLSGTWTCGCGLGRTGYTRTISDFDAVVTGSSMSAHWTMTFASVLSTGPSGTAQVVSQTLTH